MGPSMSGFGEPLADRGLADGHAGALNDRGAVLGVGVGDVLYVSLHLHGVSTEVAGVNMKRNAGYRSVSAGYRRDTADIRSSSGGNRHVDAVNSSKCDDDVSVPGGEGDNSAGVAVKAGGIAPVPVVEGPIAAVDRPRTAGNRRVAVDVMPITGGDLSVAGGELSVDGGNRDVDAGDRRVSCGIAAKGSFEGNVT